MKSKQLVLVVLTLLLLAGLFLVACAASETSPVASLIPESDTLVPFTATPVPPTFTPSPTPIPDPETTVQAFLEAWKAEDYAAMYSLLTEVSQDAITQEDFTARYTSVANQAALSGVEYEILSALVRETGSAQASYRITWQSVLVGNIQRDTLMNLSLEADGWRVQWVDDLILPELANGNYLWMDRHIPVRGNIYDRAGDALVAFTEAVSIGIVPGQISPEAETGLLNELGWLVGMAPQAIAQMYADYPPGVDWYLPLGEATLDRVSQRYDVSNGYNDRGLLMYPYTSRFYFQNGIAPHTIGYVSRIQAEEADEYLRAGYSIDEKVGRQGIERWGEEYLGGVRGGTLYVVSPNNEIVTVLADVGAQPAQAIYTSIESGLQQDIQEMLLKYRGAVVVMELDTGRVLALASSPDFDPNAFEPGNYNYSFQLNEIYGQYGGQPLLNRAVQGQYPLGSVFKIITMAAGLESGLYTPQTSYYCAYEFNEVAGIPPRYDWTWEHFQEDGKTQPSGTLTLQEGLMRSCNPYFWHIGLDLYRQGFTTAVADMARGFGLGAPTGILGVVEEAGNIPEPGEEVDAINQAIGQGDTLVTPLQVAQFIAAIGNGGTLYQPQVIDRIAPPDGEPTYLFEPVEKGQLPLSPENLAAIQNAMIDVVSNRRGTAWLALGSYSQTYPMAGKTGTAESGSGEPHAWFAGYTMVGREDRPDIAIVVIAENSGEGSEVAAPIFRGVVQSYFEGRRTYRLPWESQVGVIATPEPEDELEATPEP
ncbi:MAG: hypothetical protein JW862_08805 [Anaerolineales bacterium]|nr:hypothetical protein [Anaerolineales bacterium]